eukprot:7329692-Karenia_brevis.AAC.1
MSIVGCPGQLHGALSGFYWAMTWDDTRMRARLAHAVPHLRIAPGWARCAAITPILFMMIFRITPHVIGEECLNVWCFFVVAYHVR